MKEFQHMNARSTEEAVRLLSKHKGKAKLNAGGTDFLSLLKDRVTPDYPELVVNIKGIEDLDYIREDSEGLRIGALTKLRTIAESPVVTEKYKILAEAAGSVANPQIRNMGTIGGNLAQEVRCWYYRYPDQIGGTITCLRKGGGLCNALTGDNRYHSIFGSSAMATYPCSSHCPANTDIPAYMDRLRKGDLNEAAEIIMDFNPMPAITGRVCPIFCEPECKRGELDEPVSVRCVERALGDRILERMTEVFTPPDTESGRSVAVLGSGPAGLTAAYYLRRKGHQVIVYERLAEPGGMLLHAIPSYRLPKDLVVKQIDALKRMGIVFELGVDAEEASLIEKLSKRHHAVLAATGAWKEKAHTIKGDAPVLSGLQFLKRVNNGDRTVPGQKTAVIGGGNVAIDVARTLRRLGAQPVVIYRRGKEEMPAFKEEIEKALEEGIDFKFLTLPVEAAKAIDAISLTCLRMKLGAKDASGRRSPVPKQNSQFTALCDAVITAIGEEPDMTILTEERQNKANDSSCGHFLGENIFRAGDFMTGPSTVIGAIASGRNAARLISLSLMDERKSDRDKWKDRTPFPSFSEAGRVSPVELPLPDRSRLDSEDSQGITMTEAEKEASRCFNCGCLAVNPSDVGTALTALQGTIVTTKRSIDASAFFAPHAAASTVLDEDEMITEIVIPALPDGVRQQYLKFTLRESIDFAVAAVGSIVHVKDGICVDASIALGAVGPQPIRASAAEAKLRGRPITEETATEAAEAAASGAKPLSNNAYKIDIMRTLIKRAIMGNGDNGLRVGSQKEGE